MDTVKRAGCKTERFVGGHRLCAGCGAAVAAGRAGAFKPEVKAVSSTPQAV
jgi:hypothetical protein